MYDIRKEQATKVKEVKVVRYLRHGNISRNNSIWRELIFVYCLKMVKLWYPQVMIYNFVL